MNFLSQTNYYDETFIILKTDLLQATSSDMLNAQSLEKRKNTILFMLALLRF